MYLDTVFNKYSASSPNNNSSFQTTRFSRAYFH